MKNTMVITKNSREYEVTYRTREMEVCATAWLVDEGTSWVGAYAGVWRYGEDGDDVESVSVNTDPTRNDSPYRAICRLLANLRHQTNSPEIREALHECRRELREMR